MYTLLLELKTATDYMSLIALVVSIFVGIATIANIFATNKRLDHIDNEKKQDKKDNIETLRQRAWIIWKCEKGVTYKQLKDNWNTPVSDRATTDGEVPALPSDTKMERLLTELQNESRIIKEKDKWKAV